MLQLNNTLTRSIEPFTPQRKDEVTVYTCGPTVYSEPLIGNWVAYLRWDLLVRTLRAHGYTVRRVMNITDVGHLVSDADDGEDKMEKGARREGTTAWEIAERYTNRFLEGMTELNLLPPEVMPRATEHIEDQIALIQVLEEKGHTYRIADGIYFDTATFGSYADFARLDLDSLKAGARVEHNAEKRQASDFALWKFSQGQKRDMEWDSPWGIGFPGWHLECSAMALKYLGETLDIHTGGIDHIPVHHTNEIAQSEAATGARFANYWLHANFLLVNGTKISKSLGNGYTLADLKDKGHTPAAFRMFVLQSHYRTESNFTWENLAAAHARLNHWRTVVCLRHQADNDAADAQLTETLAQLPTAVLDALDTDLNSPKSLTVIEEVVDAIEQASRATIDRQALTSAFTAIDDMLGLELIASTPDLDEDSKRLINERTAARDAQDWVRSDLLRDELSKRGVGINDTPDGARWYYV